MIDKQQRFQALLATLSSQYKQRIVLADASKDESNELEGRNMSRYDTMRVETGWVAAGISARAAEVGEDLHQASAFQFPQSNGTICLGSYVQLLAGGAEKDFFILPFSGGLEISGEEWKYMVINPQTPIGRALIGKRKEESFEFRRKDYSIVDFL